MAVSTRAQRKKRQSRSKATRTTRKPRGFQDSDHRFIPGFYAYLGQNDFGGFMNYLDISET